MTGEKNMRQGHDLLKYWELFFYLAYLIGLLILVVPGLKWDFDGHDNALLMTGIRIWGGQVPFRDFYPWYGPLYHYLLALFVGPMGNDLYAVKIYIDLISPLLSMMILIITLRNFRLPAASRLFTLAASVFLGLERIYYCGSLRSFLPVFLVSWLYKIYREQKKMPYFLVFPAGFLLFLFTPESGIYAMITSLIFVSAALIISTYKKEKFPGAFYFAAGTGSSVLAAIILFHSTGWFANYLEFVSVASSNLLWSHGASMSRFSEQPRLLSVLAAPLIYLIALASIPIIRLRAGRPGQYSMLIVALTVLGVLLASRTLIRFHETHVQFAFLPALILASLVWAPPYKPARFWKIALQVLLVLFLWPASMITILVFTKPPFYGHDYKMLMGVRVDPKLEEIYQKTKAHFKELNIGFKVAMPLACLEYAYLGRTPDLPIIDLHYSFYPKYQQMFIDALKQNQYKFLIISDENIAWDFSQDSIDAFFDYIDSNYDRILIDGPLHVHALRKNPIELVRVVKKEPGPFMLDRRNNYSLTLQIPPDPGIDFVEFKANFKYRCQFLSRFSMPIVELFFDRKKWFYQREQSGRQRINPLPGDHTFRAYLRYPAKTLELQMTFPGMLNVFPEQITVSEVIWGRFSIDNFSARDIGYKLEK